MFGMLHESRLFNRLDGFDYQINNCMFFRVQLYRILTQSIILSQFPFPHLSSMIHHHKCSLKLTRHSLNINLWVRSFLRFSFVNTHRLSVYLGWINRTIFAIQIQLLLIIRVTAIATVAALQFYRGYLSCR